MFTREELLKHYETMVKIRKFDLEAKRAREAGEILGNVHVYVGEEALNARITLKVRIAAMDTPLQRVLSLIR